MYIHVYLPCERPHPRYHKQQDTVETNVTDAHVASIIIHITILLLLLLLLLAVVVVVVVVVVVLLCVLLLFGSLVAVLGHWSQHGLACRYARVSPTNQYCAKVAACRNIYIYIYICIYIEREREMYIYIYIYIFVAETPFRYRCFQNETSGVHKGVFRKGGFHNLCVSLVEL